MENKYKIKNLPENSDKYEYIIARLVDDDLWYYGADHNIKVASDVASRINGIVFANF